MVMVKVSSTARLCCMRPLSEPASLLFIPCAVAVSRMVRRRYTTTIEASAPIRNGTRQPQAFRSCSDSTSCSTATVNSASSCPAIMVMYWNEP
ncbi:hypothetical protein D3C79_911450 [compost metagenome]